MLFWCKGAKEMLVEGCYFVDVYGDVYAVKGLIHPPERVYAVPRIVKGVKIKSIDMVKRFVECERPEYLFDDPYTGRVVIAVPENRIAQELFPSKTPQGPEKLVEAAQNLAGYLSDVHTDFGFTGSLLTGYVDEKSDIDIVVYGGGPSVYEKLRKMRCEGVTEPVNTHYLSTLLESRRDTLKAFEMAEREPSKVLTGVFKGFLYTIKIVPETFWETWEGTRCKPLQIYEAVMEVVDDSMAFYTPGRYIVKVVEGGEAGKKCREVIYFRSRFAEMAEAGDIVKVRGLLENVVTGSGSYLRLNISLYREDYMLRCSV